MADDVQNRSSSPVLAWVEAVTRSLAPLAITALVGTGLLIWRELAVMDSRVMHLEAQANKGDRFTASDGSQLKAKVDLNYTLLREQTNVLNEHLRRGEAGFLRIDRLEKDMAECEKRCGR